MRTVLLRVDGIKRPVRKMQLEPGTRVSDILQYLHVSADYVLARASAPATPLPYEAEVHALISNGEHLIVRSNSAAAEDVTAYLQSFFQ